MTVGLGRAGLIRWSSARHSRWVEMEDSGLNPTAVAQRQACHVYLQQLEEHEKENFGLDPTAVAQPQVNPSAPNVDSAKTIIHPSPHDNSS